MGTTIMGIAKQLLAAQTGVKAERASKEAEKSPAVSFMDLMGKNNLPNMDVSANSVQAGGTSDAKTEAGAAYDASQSQMKGVTVKEENASVAEEVSPEAKEALESFEEEVKELLKEELGVTEEEIAAAMESLGLTFLDLRNVQDLTALVQELTGEDIGTLFLSEPFQNLMEGVAVQAEELCQELGITKEGLDLLCEAYEQMKPAEDLDVEALEETAELPEGEGVFEEEVPVKDAGAQESRLPEESVKTVVTDREPQQKEAEPTEEPKDEQKEVRETAQIASDSGEEESESSEEGGFLEHFKDEKPKAEHTESIFAEQANIKNERFAVPQEQVRPYTNPIDTADLIQQIARNVRVTISEAATSMEMQLNPEHLGKLYLSVSERDGVIRAQITTQNENVKQALEAQLVELRQNLGQQGVKVDAIEVTVGTHQFEQNLEQNARQEEQMHQQMEESKKHMRKNLNLNDLDGLSGLMTEEEELVAKIMRDNGNQVDLTA